MSEGEKDEGVLIEIVAVAKFIEIAEFLSEIAEEFCPIVGEREIFFGEFCEDDRSPGAGEEIALASTGPISESAVGGLESEDLRHPGLGGGAKCLGILTDVAEDGAEIFHDDPREESGGELFRAAVGIGEQLVSAFFETGEPGIGECHGDRPFPFEQLRIHGGEQVIGFFAQFGEVGLAEEWDG